MGLFESTEKIIMLIATVFGTGGVFWAFIQNKNDIKKNKMDALTSIDKIYTDMTVHIDKEREERIKEITELKSEIEILKDREKKYIEERESILTKIKGLEEIGKDKDKQIAFLKNLLVEKDKKIKELEETIKNHKTKIDGLAT